jgi:hypothetical protein
MAGDWIKIEHGLLGKPEVMLLADVLDASPHEVVGHLVAFWLWVDLNLSPDCPQVKGTKKGLDRVAGRDGFSDALISVGWLYVEDGVVSIPGYEVHLSKSAKERAKGQKKKAMQRIKLSPEKGDKKGDKTGTGQGTREEKRREEYSNIDTLPEWLKKDWVRWLDFRFAKDGQWMPEAQADAVIMDLLRRGEAKALKDIEFSIRIGAKNICHDDGGQGMLNTGSGKGGSTAGPQGGRKLTNAEKTLKLIEEMNNGSI